VIPGSGRIRRGTRSVLREWEAGAITGDEDSGGLTPGALGCVSAGGSGSRHHFGA